MNNVVNILLSNYQNGEENFNLYRPNLLHVVRTFAFDYEQE